MPRTAENANICDELGQEMNYTKRNRNIAQATIATLIFFFSKKLFRTILELTDKITFDRISPALFALFFSHVATATLLHHKAKITRRYATPALTNIGKRGLKGGKVKYPELRADRHSDFVPNKRETQFFATCNYRIIKDISG